jgi:Tfp pilus assembly PilM family ATPase
MCGRLVSQQGSYRSGEVGLGIMMLNRWFNPGRPIGCDIAGGRIRLAQVQAAKGARSVVAAEQTIEGGFQADDPASRERLAGALRQTVRSAPFRGRRVVSCVPHRDVKYRPMRLAAIPDDELASAAHWKAASELGVKSDRLKSAVIQCGDVTDGGKTRREVLTVVGEVETLERHTALLVAAGLEPVALDLSACAVARCLSAAAAGNDHADAPVPYLEFDRVTATLSVARGGRIRLIRGVGPGLARADELAASLLEVSPADAAAMRQSLAAEADTTLSPTPWPLATCPPERARLAIADAWKMYGRELAREVSLSLRHFTDTFVEPLADAGVLLSETPLGREAVAVLEDQSGVAFAAAAGLPRSDWEAAVKDSAGVKDATGEPARWLTAIGLSLYDEQPAAGKSAAGNAGTDKSRSGKEAA